MVAGVFLCCLSAFAGDIRDSASVQAFKPVLKELDRLSAQKSLSDRDLAGRFAAFAAETFDVAYMAREAIGSLSSIVTRQQYAAYIGAFEDHLARGFVAGTRRFGPTVSRPLGIRTAASGLPVFYFRSRDTKKERDVLWFLCQRDSPLVCDIEVDGIMASSRHRALFARILREEGIQGLIDGLRAGKFIRKSR